MTIDSVVFGDVRPVASNMTDAELLREVEYYYPHLRGPLAEMARRFGLQSRAARTATHEGVPLQPLAGHCPHCGSAYTVETPEDPL